MTDRELMQMVLDALEEVNKLSVGEKAICLPAEIDSAMEALRDRLAQPEPEPVLEEPKFWVSTGMGHKKPLYAAPVHAIDISQERVDETAKREHEFECPRCGHCCQQREWVGLTEQDVHDAFQFTELVKQLSFSRERPEWCENFAAYLEAKLKEKNT
jgi:hypothetical protein